MATTGSDSSITGQQLSSKADELVSIHNNMVGHFWLSPKFIRYFLDIECADKNKKAPETYKAYLERIKGSSFTKKEWKTLCNAFCDTFECIKNLDKIDVTALCLLYNSVFQVKINSGNNFRDTSKISAALKSLKDLRNEVMHSWDSALDPDALDKLELALHTFITEAGNFYSLPATEVDNLLMELKTDLKTGFPRTEKQLHYACAHLLTEGWKLMKCFVEHNFTIHGLLFDMGRVKRSDVFYTLDVKLREGNRLEVAPYSQIFELPEKVIIVSGVAGAGKSTLLENIALQYANSPPGALTHFQDFHLLVYVRCRERTAKTLKDIVKQLCSNKCNIVDENTLIEALLRLRVLFLIDGYDEYDKSMTVLQDLFKRMWQTSSKVVITSRHHAVERLIHLIGDNTDYVECEISPILGIDQQLKFLANFEPHLPGDHPAGALRAAFKNLRPSVRNLFVEPLKLLKFCNVFVTFPEKIAKWVTASDIAEDVFHACKALVRKKLADVSYPNFNIVIDDLFSIICNAALNFLRSNKLVFTEDEINMVQEECISMLLDRHDIKGLDTKIVLSSIFKIKRPFTAAGITTFSFNHMTDQEYFASKSVVKKMHAGEMLTELLLGGNTDPSNEVGAKNLEVVQIKTERWPLKLGSPFKIGESRSHPLLRPFLKVLQYVIQDLNTNSPSLLSQRWSELSQALQDAGANYRTLLDLVLACPSSDLVVKWAAETARDERDVWAMITGRDVVAATLMLRYAQPNLLSVEMRPQELEATRWPELVRSWNGDLRLWLLFSYNEWYTGYPNCDRVVAPLLHFRCRLVNFKGHLATTQGVSAIAAIASSETELQIWLSKPLQLDELNGLYKGLRVTAHPFALVKNENNSKPLPAQPPPQLIVEKCHHGSWEAVANTVQALAPIGNGYGELKLTLGSSKLSDAELDRLVVTLHERSIRTLNVRKRRASSTKIEDGIYRLNITEKLPPRLERVRNLFRLLNNVSELVSSNPQRLQSEWTELKKSFEDSGATSMEWQRLLLLCPTLPGLPRLAAEATLREKQDWIIENSRDLEAVALMLPHARPRHLSVRTDPQNLTTNGWSELTKLWGDDLYLNFGSDSPCDDVLAPLHCNRCRVVGLTGRLTKQFSVDALAAAATTPDGDLKVWLKTPLQLTALQGKFKRLGVHTKPLLVGHEAAERAPLPTQPAPEIVIEMSSVESVKNVVHTVQTYAPSDNRYQTIFLVGGNLVVAGLDQLMTTLHKLGIRTVRQEITGRVNFEQRCMICLGDELRLTAAESAVEISAEEPTAATMALRRL